MPDPQAPRKLFDHARREAWVVTIVWAIALVWAVGVCYVMGYEHTAESLVVSLGLAEAGRREPGIVLGFPDWVVWGILVPWVTISLFTVWFGMWGIADDELQEDAAEQGGRHGH